MSITMEDFLNKLREAEQYSSEFDCKNNRCSSIQIQNIRSGKWLESETIFCNELIRGFKIGIFNFSKPILLRPFLAYMLDSDTMRISKKFTSNNNLDNVRRVFFKKNDQDFTSNQKQIENLLPLYIQYVEEVKTVSKKKKKSPDVDSSINQVYYQPHSNLPNIVDRHQFPNNDHVNFFPSSSSSNFNCNDIHLTQVSSDVNFHFNSSSSNIIYTNREQILNNDTHLNLNNFQQQYIYNDHILNHGMYNQKELEYPFSNHQPYEESNLLNNYYDEYQMNDFLNSHSSDVTSCETHSIYVQMPFGCDHLLRELCTRPRKVLKNSFSYVRYDF